MISHFSTGIFQALKLEAVQGNGAHTNPVNEVGNHPNDVILRLKLRLQPKLHFLQLICDPTFYLLSYSSKSAFSVSNIFEYLYFSKVKVIVTYNITPSFLPSYVLTPELTI